MFCNLNIIKNNLFLNAFNFCNYERCYEKHTENNYNSLDKQIFFLDYYNNNYHYDDNYFFTINDYDFKYYSNTLHIKQLLQQKQEYV